MTCPDNPLEGLHVEHSPEYEFSLQILLLFWAGLQVSLEGNFVLLLYNITGIG